jgi:predicted kinase
VRAVRDRGPSRAAERILSVLNISDANRGPSAALVLLSGLPGSGKTTFATSLAAMTGAVHIESDRLRGLLFNTPVFSTRENSILFSAIRSAARKLLDDRRGVIIDATNVSEGDRKPFYALADATGVPLLIAQIDAPAPEIERRLRQRRREGVDYSYADEDVYHRMKSRAEPISRAHWYVNTDVQAVTESALAAMAAQLKEAPRVRVMAGEARGTTW